MRWIKPKNTFVAFFIATTKSVYDTPSIQTMSKNVAISLHTLPVELVYRILENLDQLTIFFSCGGVCVRLNSIIASYHPYSVIIYSLQCNRYNTILFIQKFITFHQENRPHSMEQVAIAIRNNTVNEGFSFIYFLPTINFPHRYWLL